MESCHSCSAKPIPDQFDTIALVVAIACAVEMRSAAVFPNIPVSRREV
ncbi:MAG: hypothetical protein U7126_23645 [Microcoleus sp.]